MTDAHGDAGPSRSSTRSATAAVAEPNRGRPISLAGAGCALGIVGVLVFAGDTGLDDASGDFSRVPGVLLSALVVAIGYFVLSAVRRGPVATAGAVAAAARRAGVHVLRHLRRERLPAVQHRGHPHRVHGRVARLLS